MRSGRDNKPEGMSDDLRADLSGLFSKICRMWVVEFGISPLLAINTHGRLCRFLLVSLDLNARPGDVTIC